MELNIFIISVSVVLGLVFGSFANAFAYRVPTGESLMTRSHCPKCDKEIKAWENIPILSWLILRGKCSNCKLPISAQYPIVEAVTALLFGLLAWSALSLDFGNIALIFVLIGYFTLAFSGVALSIIDFKEKILPTKIIYPTLAIVVITLSIASALEGDFWQVGGALIGMVVLFVVYYLFWFFGKGGRGDVRLALVLGFALAWISWPAFIFGFFAPYLISILYVLPKLITKKAKGKTEVPFGPWFILGAIIAIVWGDKIMNLYLQLGGIS